MAQRDTQWLTMVVGCMALSMCAAGFGVAAFGATPQEAGSALVMQERTAGSITGSFGSNGALVSFSGGIAEGQRVWASLEIGGVLLEATYDTRTETIHWDGHNTSLTVEDKEALIAFSQALESSLGTKDAPDAGEVSLHEQLLYGLALHLAEAPVGLPLTARTLRLPTIRQGAKSLPDVSQEESAEKEGDVTVQACQRSGEDGILSFTSCATVTRTIEHDATTHCFIRESIRSGPGSDDCLGRCGPGCGCGWGVYTYDCGDHDRCCRVHGSCLNPRDASCGDEWQEAADDTIFGQLRARKCFACRF